MTMSTPPPLATWLLRHLGKPNEALAGDLLEKYETKRSDAWYWRQVLFAIAAGRSVDALVMVGALALLEPRPARASAGYQRRTARADRPSVGQRQLRLVRSDVRRQPLVGDDLCPRHRPLCDGCGDRPCRGVLVDARVRPTTPCLAQSVHVDARAGPGRAPVARHGPVPRASVCARADVRHRSRLDVPSCSDGLAHGRHGLPDAVQRLDYGAAPRKRPVPVLPLEHRHGACSSRPSRAFSTKLRAGWVSSTQLAWIVVRLLGTCAFVAVVSHFYARNAFEQKPAA